MPGKLRLINAFDKGPEWRSFWGHSVENEPASAGITFAKYLGRGWLVSMYRISDLRPKTSGLAVERHRIRWQRRIWLVYGPEVNPEVTALRLAAKYCEIHAEFEVREHEVFKTEFELHQALRPVDEPAIKE